MDVAGAKNNMHGNKEDAIVQLHRCTDRLWNALNVNKWRNWFLWRFSKATRCISPPSVLDCVLYGCKLFTAQAQRQWWSVSDCNQRLWHTQRMSRRLKAQSRCISCMWQMQLNARFSEWLSVNAGWIKNLKKKIKKKDGGLSVCQCQDALYPLRNLNKNGIEFCELYWNHLFIFSLCYLSLPLKIQRAPVVRCRSFRRCTFTDSRPPSQSTYVFACLQR